MAERWLVEEVVNANVTDLEDECGCMTVLDEVLHGFGRCFSVRIVG